MAIHVDAAYELQEKTDDEEEHRDDSGKEKQALRNLRDTLDVRRDGYLSPSMTSKTFAVQAAGL